MGAECNSGYIGAEGRQGVQLLAVGYMKAGGPIHVHGAEGAATYSG